MNRSRTSKNIKIVLSVLLVIIIVNVAFAGNNEMEQAENDTHPVEHSHGQIRSARNTMLNVDDAQEAVPEVGSVASGGIRREYLLFMEISRCIIAPSFPLAAAIGSRYKKEDRKPQRAHWGSSFSRKLL